RSDAPEYGEVYVEVPYNAESSAHDDRPSRDCMRPSGRPLPRDESRERRPRRRPFAFHIAGRKGTPPTLRGGSAGLQERSRVSSCPDRSRIGGALEWQEGKAR